MRCNRKCTAIDYSRLCWLSHNIDFDCGPETSALQRAVVYKGVHSTRTCPLDVRVGTPLYDSFRMSSLDLEQARLRAAQARSRVLLQRATAPEKA